MEILFIDGLIANINLFLLLIVNETKKKKINSPAGDKKLDNLINFKLDKKNCFGGIFIKYETSFTKEICRGNGKLILLIHL